MIKKKRLLVVSDIPNWAFDKMYRNLKKYCDHWEVDVFYLEEKKPQRYNLSKHQEFDLIFYLCDYAIEALLAAKIPKEKVILGIRSHRTEPFYKNTGLLRNTAGAIAVANNTLGKEFIKLHPFTRTLQGGVDTELFKPGDREPYPPFTVGWAGTQLNTPKGFRGLRIIADACKYSGLKFNPALREKEWRNEEEMARYYQNDIDIYIDLSKSAGRQNGILEAGACGKMVIATNVGVVDQLIIPGITGLVIKEEERNVEELSKILSKLRDDIIKRCGNQLCADINKYWSWKSHVKGFEKLFDDLINFNKLQLNPIPDNNWKVEIGKLLKDPYISKKFNRPNRIIDKLEYIDKFLPEVKSNPGRVLDIGCGPGEFLEWCRYFGNDIIGIDASLDDCEMGNEYIRLSKLITTRQSIDVKYVGFDNILKEGKLPISDNSIKVVNSQGAIEQIFKDFLIGPPHREHKNCNRLSWNMSNKMIKTFTHFFDELYRILETNGVCFIYGNGAKNTDEYDAMITKIIKNKKDLEMMNIKLTGRDIDYKNKIHKIRKVK